MKVFASEICLALPSAAPQRGPGPPIDTRQALGEQGIQTAATPPSN